MSYFNFVTYHDEMWLWNQFNWMESIILLSISSLNFAMRILAFDQHLDSADLFRNREHKMKEAILPCLAVHTADFYLTRLSECKLLHKTEMAFG